MAGWRPDTIAAPVCDRGPVSIRSDRRYRFDQGRATVWDALTRVEDYRAWWPWLRAFDGVCFAEGAKWHCVVKPQLPYTLEFDILLTEVVARDRVHAELFGDIHGIATLALAGDGDGCELRLVSDLGAGRGVARLVDRFVPPLAAIGHDWVLDNGIGQFRAGALGQG
jgi:hypothetical protein